MLTKYQERRLLLWCRNESQHGAYARPREKQLHKLEDWLGVSRRHILECEGFLGDTLVPSRNSPLILTTVLEHLAERHGLRLDRCSSFSPVENRALSPANEKKVLLWLRQKCPDDISELKYRESCASACAMLNVPLDALRVWDSVVKVIPYSGPNRGLQDKIRFFLSHEHGVSAGSQGAAGPCYGTHNPQRNNCTDCELEISCREKTRKREVEEAARISAVLGVHVHRAPKSLTTLPPASSNSVAMSSFVDKHLHEGLFQRQVLGVPHDEAHKRVIMKMTAEELSLSEEDVNRFYQRATDCTSPSPLEELHTLFKATKYFGPRPFEVLRARTLVGLTQVADIDSRRRVEKYTEPLSAMERTRSQEWVFCAYLWGCLHIDIGHGARDLVNERVKVAIKEQIDLLRQKEEGEIPAGGDIQEMLDWCPDRDIAGNRNRK